LFEQPFLLSDLFPTSFDKAHIDRLDRNRQNQAIRNWLSRIETEAQLIEKLAMRIKTNALRKNLDLTLGSEKYLRALIDMLYLELIRLC
jgi:hypothetical protein